MFIVIDSWILRPVKGKANATLRKSPTLEQPKLELRLHFDAVRSALSAQHYRAVLNVTDAVRRSRRRRPYRRWRPTVPVKRHARVWWHFAAKCVTKDVVDRKERRRWTFMKRFAEARRTCNLPFF